MRTCPTAALEAILELEPLHLTIEQAAKRTLLNFAREGFGRGRTISLRNRDKLGSQVPLALLPRDDRPKVVNFDRNFKIELCTKATWSSSLMERLIQSSSLQWYTDGSKTPEGIGAGVYGPRLQLSVPMGAYPSIFQAEVYAISLCAEINLRRNYRNERILILSDSQAALKANSS
ncbi:uncharacterized protein LOC118749151 [Rhagoletis pomonella]|uniref:uncharacterized protein LOC118749151 n=1 Tax=Rhagoletis pomonella TaxID=28610 RepID=UPI00177FFF54|nr:uncharacterized protein LOC118749151 [Rhagoletis pomonella]